MFINLKKLVNYHLEINTKLINALTVEEKIIKNSQLKTETKTWIAGIIMSGFPIVIKCDNEEKAKKIISDIKEAINNNGTAINELTDENQFEDEVTAEM